MLKSIFIENFLIIRSLQLHFNNGLTVISGESGAGKSTIIDAICWCLGIENKRTKNICNVVVKLEFKDHQVVREANKQGKSTFFLNGSKVVKKNILTFFNSLITICRQDNRLSFSVDDDFRAVIDSMITEDNLLNKLKERFSSFQMIQDEIKELNELCSEDIEYIRSVVDDINALQLTGNDEEKLVLEKREQIEMYKSHESLQKAMKVFSEGKIISYMDALTKYLNSDSPKIIELQQRVDSINQELKDIEESISDIIEISESNEERIESIDKKLSKIREVARRYKMNTNQLLDLSNDYRQKIDTVLNLEAKKSALSKKLGIAQQGFSEISNDVNLMREKICKDLNTKISEVLDEIMMSDIKVEFSLSDCRWNEFGTVQIKLSILGDSNKKRNPSGGEMSRLLLAIKIATANLETPILFDEIDIGIGGSTAYKIGNKLESLARIGQIIVATHQAQVAAHGQNHILVSKKNGVSNVKILSKAQRVEEISRMISGSEITQESISAAQKLLEQCCGADRGT